MVRTLHIASYLLSHGLVAAYIYTMYYLYIGLLTAGHHKGSSKKFVFPDRPGHDFIAVRRVVTMGHWPTPNLLQRYQVSGHILQGGIIDHLHVLGQP